MQLRERSGRISSLLLTVLLVFTQRTATAHPAATTGDLSRLTVRPAQDVSTTFVTEAASVGDLGTIRERIVGYLTAEKASRSEMLTVNALDDLGPQTATTAQKMGSTGAFADLKYNTSPAATWGVTDHFRRLLTMAKAFRTYGSGYQGDGALRAQIQAGLSYGLKTYAPTTCPYGVSCGNWWHWQIGVPIVLGPTLVLMQQSIEPSVFNLALESLRTHIGPAPSLTGQNLAWTATAHLYYAVLTTDLARMADVYAAMVTVAGLSTEGIRPDYSFQQHGPQLMTGAYGGSCAMTLAEYAYWVRDTSFELPPANFDLLVNYIDQGIRWAVRGQEYDHSVLGREVTRYDRSSVTALSSILLLATLPSTAQASLQASAKSILSSWPTPLPVELAEPALLALASPALPQEPWGFRAYPNSDYVAFHQPAYFASVKMISTRTQSGELVNGENKKGSLLSDGRLYLVLSGDEYSRKNVVPTMDWARLPGITVERKANVANSTYGRGKKVFVGGVSDGRNGVAAMDFAARTHCVTAKKSWVFFDDSIVFLTSAINCASGNPVDTVINQWPMRSATTPVYVDGVPVSPAMGYSTTQQGARWAYADGIGYRFLSSTPVKVETATLSGAWSAIGAGPTTVYSNPFLTLTHLHNTYPVNADSAYAIVPGLSSVSAMSDWVARAYIRVLQNTGAGAGVEHLGKSMTGRVFWQAGTIAGVSSSAPGVLMTRKKDTTLEVSYASPDQVSTGTATVTIPGTFSLAWSSSGSITLQCSGAATRVTFPRGKGQSLRVVLSQ
jgi:chondroitin AC lyase